MSIPVGLKAWWSARTVTSTWTLALVGCLGLSSIPNPASAATEGAGAMQINTAVRRSLLEAPVDLNIENDMLPLSLEQAVEIALRRNLGLVVQRYDREQAQLSVFGNRGIYDTGVSATTSRSSRETATANQTQAGTSKNQVLNLGLQQLVKTGGQLGFLWSNSKTESTNRFFDLNPSYDAQWNLSFDQPLFRGLGSLVTERQLRIAKLNSRISRETFESEVTTTIQNVEQAYWNLIDAREQLRVAHESLDLAKELHERNKIEVEVGTRAPLELVQSEATIATRQEGIIRAEQVVGDAEDNLRRMLNLPTDLWSVPIDPTTEAATEPIEIDLDQAIQVAYQERPEVRSQRLAIDRAEVDAAFARNQKKPRLDLSLEYQLQGLGGKGLLTDPNTGETTSLDTDLIDALQQILNRDAVGWSLSLTFGYPLQNRSARAASLQADLAVDQEEVRLDDLRREILTEVRSAVRQVNTAAQQITSSEVSRRLQERNLDAEQKRYENGMSTSFQVTQIQDDVTQARSNEVTALTAYRIALAGYQTAIGRLLEEFKIEIVDDASGGGKDIDDRGAHMGQMDVE